MPKKIEKRLDISDPWCYYILTTREQRKSKRSDQKKRSEREDQKRKRDLRKDLVIPLKT